MDARDKIRGSIKEQLRRAPSWIGSASIQKVREFKKFHAGAAKVADQGNASISKLTGMLMAVNDMYK